jgi:hypothetical protein
MKKLILFFLLLPAILPAENSVPIYNPARAWADFSYEEKYMYLHGVYDTLEIAGVSAEAVRFYEENMHPLGLWIENIEAVYKLNQDMKFIQAALVSMPGFPAIDILYIDGIPESVEKIRIMAGISENSD